MDDPAPDIAAKGVGAHPVPCIGRCKPMRGIDAERIEAADEIGGYRSQHKNHHDDQADSAEHVALRKERQLAPALGGMGARASQFGIVVDRCQIAS